MVEATTQAGEVVRAAIGGPSLLGRLPAELLHGVEAAAWLERLAAASRHLFVPAAK